MKKRMGIGAILALAALLALPGAAFAQGNGVGALSSQLDTTWVMVACVLVLFMQAGFLLLEIGFSRQKNVGAGVAKVLVNLAVVTLAWWAVGYGISSRPGTRSSAPTASSSTPDRRSAAAPTHSWSAAATRP